MKLSAEQFADLAASFPGYAAPEGKHERRRAARLELCAHVAIRFLHDNVIALPTPVAINNFSPRGLGLLHQKQLDPGMQFVTELPRKSGGTISFLCTVMHNRKVSEGLYQIGVEFTCTLRQPVVAAPVEQIASELQRIRTSVLG